MHGVVQQPLLGGLEAGHIGQGADQANHFGVGAHHRTRAQSEPQIMPVGRAHAKILGNAPAPLFEHAVERGAEAVAVERMQDFQPLGGRALERSALEPEHGFGLGAGEDVVG